MAMVGMGKTRTSSDEKVHAVCVDTGKSARRLSLSENKTYYVVQNENRAVWTPPVRLCVRCDVSRVSRVLVSSV